MVPLRVLLVAQSPVLRIGIRGLLENAFAVSEIAEADGALESVTLLAAARPDLVIIQDALPGVTGVVAARMVRQFRPRVAILVLSDHVNETAVSVATRHGADALLPSTVTTELFLATVRSLQPVPDKELDSVVADEADNRLRDLENLRGGDIAILDGLARGLSPREVAAQLLVSEQTVRARTAGLVRKLNAVDRTTAVVAAVRSGMVDLSVQLPSAHVEWAASA